MEIFQKKILEAVAALEGVFVIADDVLIVGRGKNDEEALKDHNQNFERLLRRLKEKGVKLNKEKTNLCATSIKFYGHILSKEGMRPNPEKVSAISAMPRPSNKAEVQRFLGMVTYLTRYIHDLSNVAKPLRDLVHKDRQCAWDEGHEQCFLTLKKMVTEAPVLSFYDSSKEIVIQTDASAYAMGCVLLQEGRPVAYGSKLLTKSQCSYAQIEKEMLAVLFACRKFDQYICGRKRIIIDTDHSPLINILKKPLLKAPKRLQSMILCLQRYNIILKYRRGTEMIIADALSRAPESTVNEETTLDIYEISEDFSSVDPLLETRVKDSTVHQIRQESLKDEKIKTLIDLIKRGWPKERKGVPESLRCFWNYREELVEKDDMVLKGCRLVVPTSLRKGILKKLHSAHCGIENMVKLAKQSVFWPSIKSDIKELLLNCETCQKFAPNQQRDEMIIQESPQTPYERVGLDACEANINGRTRRFLTSVDHYADFFFFFLSRLSNI